MQAKVTRWPQKAFLGDFPDVAVARGNDVSLSGCLRLGQMRRQLVRAAMTANCSSATLLDASAPATGLSGRDCTTSESPLGCTNTVGKKPCTRTAKARLSSAAA